jgi:biopolymer transport protein ExbD
MHQISSIFKPLKPFMKHLFYSLLFIFICACGKEKIVQLPEISHSKISTINDVSAAYLFYDENKPDKVELNRKNLISTTNWLVNVDKRLTLKQVIPEIIFLQEKKQNAEMHKNENAKNYFTCNDTSIKNLGFIEFTDVVYHEENSKTYVNKKKRTFKQLINIRVHSIDSTFVSFISNDTSFTHTTNQKELLKHLKTNLNNQGNAIIVSEFEETLSFQDYITFKSLISKIDFKNVTIANDEFVFN